MKTNDLSTDTLSRYELVFSEDEVKLEIDKMALELQAKQAIGKYLRGEAPIDFVHKLFGGQFLASATDALLGRALGQISSDMGLSNIKPIIEPAYRAGNGRRHTGIKNADGSYSVIVNWERPKYMTLSSLDEIEITLERESKESAIAAQLEILKIRSASHKTVERESIDTDTINVSIEVQVDGQTVKGGSFPIYTLVPKFKESNYFGSQLNIQAVGKKVGDTFSYTKKFLPGHKDKYLAGHEATINCVVLDVFESVVPTIDDEFAVAVGCKDLEELKEKISVGWQKSSDRKAEEQASDAVKNHMVEKNPVEIAAERLDKAVAETIAEQGLDPAKILASEDESLKAYVEKTREYYRGALAYVEIRRAVVATYPEEMKLTEADLLRYVMRNNKSRNTPEQELAALRGTLHYNGWLSNQKLQKAHEFLTSKVKILWKEHEAALPVMPGHEVSPVEVESEQVESTNEA